jgi:predicted regulator of Ras-like GTPase activity (Roadblock/LC7/MglB family)
MGVLLDYVRLRKPLIYFGTLLPLYCPSQNLSDRLAALLHGRLGIAVRAYVRYRARREMLDELIGVAGKLLTEDAIRRAAVVGAKGAKIAAQGPVHRLDSLFKAYAAGGLSQSETAVRTLNGTREAGAHEALHNLGKMVLARADRAGEILTLYEAPGFGGESC